MSIILKILQWNYQLTKQNWHFVCLELCYYSTDFDLRNLPSGQKSFRVFRETGPSRDYPSIYFFGFIAFVESLMVSCYGYEIWRHKYQGVKPIFRAFSFFSTIMVNLVTKILQSVCLCVIFHVKHKELLFLAVLTWFQILGKIQNGGQDGDPSTKGKIVSKYCNISKLRGAVTSTPLPPCTTLGVWICVYVQGLIWSYNRWVLISRFFTL